MLEDLHWLELLVLAVGFVIIIGIGVTSARRSDSAEGYFLAGRSLSGWLVGFSVMATIVSSMTFLANPASPTSMTGATCPPTARTCWP